MKNKEKRNNNTVWTWPYCTKYYLTHPWKWFSQLGRNIRAAHLRATRGWCPWDVWDWDCWFMYTAPEMFRYLAEHGHAYPGTEPFETPEKWREWLHKMADQIESCTEDAQNKNNEFYEEYIKHLEDSWEPLKEDENGMVYLPHRGRTELDEKYFARSEELAKKAQNDIEDALKQIGEHFYSLWD